jgi:hypothetical protein
MLEHKRVYITVKTYPTLSEKYNELVCTAGFCEDGSWIRLYPLPFRLLEKDQKYKKWQWIEVDIERRTSDVRPESYRVPNIDNLAVISEKTAKIDWNERKKIIFKKEKFFTNKAEILLLTKTNPPTKTLVTFKPSSLVKFYTKPAERDWPAEKMKIIEENSRQLTFTSEDVKSFQAVKKIPYEFRYVFTDDEGVQSDLMIEDWEIGILYLKCLKIANGNEVVALEKVKKRYWDDFLKKDIYFFLGTCLKDQMRSPNPFSIVGVFYPPLDDKPEQYSLFDE